MNKVDLKEALRQVEIEVARAKQNLRNVRLDKDEKYGYFSVRDFKALREGREKRRQLRFLVDR